MEKRFIRDDYEKSFHEFEEKDFLDEVTAMENAGAWEDHKAHEMNIAAPCGPLTMDSIISGLRFGTEEEIAADTMEQSDGYFGSKLFLDTPTGYVPMRRKATAQVVCAALGLTDELQKKDEDTDPGVFQLLYDAVKDAKNRKNRTVQVWVCGGKVTAAGTGDYCIMQIDELLARVLGKLKETFPVMEFTYGFNSYDYTKAVWKIEGEEKDKLTEQYKAMFRDRPVPDLEFTVTVKTSNRSSSSAYIIPVLEADDGSRIPIGAQIEVKHLKRAGGVPEGIDALVSLASGVFAKFGDARARFGPMSETIISYPRDCLLRLCKKAGLPGKLASQCADDLQAYLAGNGKTSCTMFEVYLSICKAIVYGRANGSSDRDCDNYEEAIARIVRYNWSAEDKAVDAL